MYFCGGFTRGNWEIYRRDSNSPRVIAMVSANRSFLEPDYDEYSASTTRSLMCFRSVALIVHTLSLSLSLSLSLCTCVCKNSIQRFKMVTSN